ncbi:MAG TPA: DEAD/DEAH box helicase [Candidatus Paceibacterota bacterium]|nr:DEAD/DEAH box helicase [Candidatus Paceibacterota bacterium]
MNTTQSRGPRPARSRRDASPSLSHFSLRPPERSGFGAPSRFRSNEAGAPRSRSGEAPASRSRFAGGSKGGFSSSSRSRFGEGNRGRFSGKKNNRKSDYIDESKFINRAVEVEEVQHVAKHTFADFNVHPQLATNLERKGFVQPSPIQDQSIPVALEGKDVIGIANTGTGKTAAFLIPIINKLVSDPDHKAMVLTPTRELAQQIEQEFRAMTFGMRMWSVAAVGGLPIMRQIRQLELGVHIVIGTPGRVKDLIARGKINLNNYRTIVLDEADRMLDMGFIDDMREILGGMPKDRQGLFFSATFSSEIKALCSDFLKDPVTVAIKTRDTAASVDQDIVRAHPSEKLDKLHDLLNKPEFKKVLIFRETKHHTDELARELKHRGFSVSALHGDMRSRERSRAVDALTKGQIQAVIATDVAARGIDIPDITHVINYDVPSTYDTYVHRIGRTGRGNKKGTALTFVR